MPDLEIKAEDMPRIESPIHQLKQLDDAIADTGTGMLAVFELGVIAVKLAHKGVEEIVEILRELLLMPEQLMGERPADALPVKALFTFVEKEIAQELATLKPDAKPEIPTDE